MSGIFGTTAAATSSTTTTIGDLKNDVAIANPPDDTVSDLTFSPTADILAIASWDNKVRLYQIASNGSSEGKHIYEHDGPALSLDFSKVPSPLRNTTRPDSSHY